MRHDFFFLITVQTSPLAVTENNGTSKTIEDQKLNKNPLEAGFVSLQVNAKSPK